MVIGVTCASGAKRRTLSGGPLMHEQGDDRDGGIKESRDRDGRGDSEERQQQESREHDADGAAQAVGRVHPAGSTRGAEAAA